MAGITAQAVAELRKRTGAGILDCRKALEENGGELDAAEKWLREQGKASAGKRADRERSEGAVAVVVDSEASGARGAIVALECETDFVAKSAEFVQLVDELAAELATGGEEALAAQHERVEKLALTSKENVAIGRSVRFETGPSGVIGSYLHIQNGRGVNAVLVELEGGTQDLAHDIAVHIAFARPEFASRDDVPADRVEAERQTAEAIARNENKPEAALPKIVEGRLNGWFKERVLLEQAYVRDEKRTIADYLGSAKLERFAQVVVGS
jgi:elongation factor Ts